jgi:hypothetical protein
MVTRRGKSTPIVRSYRAEPCRPTKIEVSTGGGEVAHYIARHGESRISKPSTIAKRNGALLWITLPHMGSYMAMAAAVSIPRGAQCILGVQIEAEPKAMRLLIK